MKNRKNKTLLDHKVQTLTLQRFGRAFTIALVIVSLGLLVLELLGHRYAEVDIEGMFFFPAIFGFVSFVFIVLAGKLLRRVLMRDESYYADEDYFANRDHKPKPKPKPKGGRNVN